MDAVTTFGLRSAAVVEWTADRGAQRRDDDLAVEEALEIRVNGAPVSVTMRTPGDDFDLAAGFLFTERIVRERADVAAIAFGRGADGLDRRDIVEVTLRAGVAVDLTPLERHFQAASSCGVCGKTSIGAVRVPGIQAPAGMAPLDPRMLCALPDTARAAQRVFDRTGGMHAAALFDVSGALLAVREDIGRHNAVDKIVGHALLNNQVPLSARILFVSGRGAFEIVQKALVAGVPLVASVSAPSSLAVELAREHDLTLVGFLRGQRFVVYSGGARIASLS